MTSSIVFTERIKVEFDKKGKFNYTDLNETYTFERNEIPFVRYRFKKYGVAEIAYIRENIKRFNHSAHLAEVCLSDTSAKEIELLSSLEEVAIFIYIDLHKDNILAKNLDETNKKLLESIKEHCLDKIERVMLRDKDNMLHMLVIRPLIKNISVYLGLSESKIGFCSCAFSIDGMCCLTAERARDIAARYSNNKSFAIATNAVEGKNMEYQHGCCCIKHIIISHDIDGTKEVVSEIDSFMKPNEFGDIKEIKEVKNKKSKESIDKFPEDYKVDGQLAFDGEGKILEEKNESKKVESKKKKKLKIPKNAIKF